MKGGVKGPRDEKKPRDPRTVNPGLVPGENPRLSAER